MYGFCLATLIDKPPEEVERKIDEYLETPFFNARSICGAVGKFKRRGKYMDNDNDFNYDLGKKMNITQHYLGNVLQSSDEPDWVGNEEIKKTIEKLYNQGIDSEPIDTEIGQLVGFGIGLALMREARLRNPSLFKDK